MGGLLQISYVRDMRWYITCILLFLSITIFAQDELVSDESPKFTAKGYLKNMSSFNWYDSLYFENLVHNRINLAWYPSSQFTAYLEFRNRVFVGDFVKKIPNYGDVVNSNNDFFKLSYNVIETESVIVNMMIDRAYVSWVKNDWEIKLGRQRINWGVNLAWNPNDWFNAYSFFDFDYEERPGSDAFRVSYYTGVASSIEVAAKIAEDMDHFVAAGMWKINKGTYDIQFLGGVANGDLALGAGWAGNLKGAGFKGEFTYFEKVVETEVNAFYDRMFLGALSVDYSFLNSLYLNGSIMFNSNGSNDPDFGFTLINQRIGGFTVRDLSPYYWSAFIQSGYQFSPLWFGGLSLIGYPGSTTFFINPSVSYSIVENLDLNVVGQLFFGDDAAGDYGSIAQSLFVRFKWSF